MNSKRPGAITVVLLMLHFLVVAKSVDALTLDGIPCHLVKEETDTPAKDEVLRTLNCSTGLKAVSYSDGSGLERYLRVNSEFVDWGYRRLLDSAITYFSTALGPVVPGKTNVIPLDDQKQIIIFNAALNQEFGKFTAISESELEMTDLHFYDPRRGVKTEFVSWILSRGGQFKILMRSGSTVGGVSPGQVLPQRLKKLRDAGWKIVKHLHFHPFLNFTGLPIRVVGGTPAPSTADLSAYVSFMHYFGTRRFVITNGIETLTMNGVDVRKLAKVCNLKVTSQRGFPYPL